MEFGLFIIWGYHEQCHREHSRACLLVKVVIHFVGYISGDGLASAQPYSKLPNGFFKWLYHGHSGDTV